MTTTLDPTLEEWMQRDPQAVAAVLGRESAGFFINRFCKILDYQRGRTIPLEERPIQQRFRELITEQRLVVGLKAREVGWTWELAALSLWEAWRYAPAQIIYMCQREENAKQFISRVRFIHKRLPEWLPYPPEHGQETQQLFVIRTPEGDESEIRSLSASPAALEGWHPRRVIADEWGKIPGKVLPSALGAVGLDGYFVGLDTAQGLGNEHADVYISCRDGNPEQYAHEGQRFYHIFASWTDNPDFRVRPSGGTKRDTERMYPENDMEAFALTAPGEAVYPEYNPSVHVSRTYLQHDPHLMMIRGWDFGYQRPACVVFQFNALGQTLILREYQWRETGPEAFIEHVLTQCQLEFPRCRWADWGDPSGNAHRDTSARTVFEIMRREFSLKVKSGKASHELRRRAVGRRLSLMVRGRPAMLIDPRCTLIKEAFGGMYHYPVKRGAEETANFLEQRAQLGRAVARA